MARGHCSWYNGAKHTKENFEMGFPSWKVTKPQLVYVGMVDDKQPVRQRGYVL